MNRRKLLIAGGALAVSGVGALAYRISQTSAMDDYAAAVAVTRVGLPEQPGLKDIIRFATLAANGHNTQPWQFRIGSSRVEIMPDLRRRTPIVDPDDHHLFVSLGCAAENLAIAGASRGHHGELIFDSSANGRVVFELDRGPSEKSPLLDAITMRQSTRAEYDGHPVTAADLNLLSDAAAIPGVNLVVITERAQIDHMIELVVEGNSAQMADAAFLRELKTWLRFNARQAIETSDGLFSAASGNPIVPTWVGRSLFDLAFRAGPENEKYVRHLRSSAGIAVFVSERDDKEHWVRAGQACQRFALQATALGLKHAFVNQPVEVPTVRAQLATHLQTGGRRPDLVMRFGYGPELPRSLRRPVDQVILHAEQFDLR